MHTHDQTLNTTRIFTQLKLFSTAIVTLMFVNIYTVLTFPTSTWYTGTANTVSNEGGLMITRVCKTIYPFHALAYLQTAKVQLEECNSLLVSEREQFTI